mgnify:FL=1|tara:strand:+ start:358 stop:549 length:192 start_codon:yes stop_codon:yes gene_type:complete
MKTIAKQNHRKRIIEAGKRALAEAQKRQRAKKSPVTQIELGGREGPEPTRFGDWEKKGIATDF